MMKDKIFTFLKLFIFEVLVIFSLILLINNFVGNVDKTIQADGVGYYDYLPSLFIHSDILRKDSSFSTHPELYKRIDQIGGVYVNYDDHRVNKYPCGTAILQAPFFAFALATTDLENTIDDGYQKPFQRAVFYATIFYLLLSLLFLKKILKLYDVKNYIIIFCQIFLVFSTSVIHYANAEAGFSHVYSLFAITAFLFFAKQYFLHRKSKHIIISAGLLGLIFILRQPNILIVLFLPFLAGSYGNLIASFRSLFIAKKSLFLAVLLFLGVVFIQMVLWYVQTGNFLVYSYQGEGFDFLDPQFVNILFSYKKGLFIYTPVVLIATLSISYFLIKKEYYLFFTWVSFFILITYFLSSWWSWFYGCSYGLRAYVDFYPVFFIAFAIVLNQIKTGLKVFILVLSLLTIPINVIQTYQYKEFILHWIDMDKEKYWKVFLKTDHKYKGLVWKNRVDLEEFTLEKELQLNDIDVVEKNRQELFSVKSEDIPNFDKVNVIQVLLEDEFSDQDYSKLGIEIHGNNKKYYSHDRYLIHFHESRLNEKHQGLYNFFIEPFSDSTSVKIILKGNVESGYKQFNNVRMKFLSKK